MFASVTVPAVLQCEAPVALSHAGGKWTTYRRMAEDALNTAVELKGIPTTRQCSTSTLKLLGGQQYRPALHTEVTESIAGSFCLSGKGSHHCWTRLVRAGLSMCVTNH
jgi:glycerol-3-phosphate dehydrogenase